MAKNLKDILAGKNTSTIKDLDLGGYSPKPADEKNFVAKHKVQKHDDRVGNEDDVYQATNVKHSQVDPDEKRHGYKKPEDKKVYEDAQCNMTEAGTSCSVHGMKECSSYGGSVIKEKGKEVNEVMSKSAKAEDWINDFINSDNPKFAGKSKEKRKEMALAAYYAKQRNEEVEELDEVSKKTLGSYIKKAASDMARQREKRVDTSGTRTDQDKAHNKEINRKYGINQAVNRLTKEEVELDEDDKHFEKQTPKMQTAINMHLRKGKSYADAVKAAKVHVKEEVEELDEISRDLARRVIRKAAGEKEMGYGKKDRTNVLSLAGKKAYPEIVGKPRVPATTEEVELDEQGLRQRTSRTKAVHVKHPRPDKQHGIKKQMESLAMPLLGSKDSSKYDDESAEMAKTQLKALANKALHLMMQIPDDMILEPWVQSKITIAKDYVNSVHDYMIFSDKDGIKKDIEKESDTAGAMQFPGVNVNSAGYNI